MAEKKKPTGARAKAAKPKAVPARAKAPVRARPPARAKAVPARAKAPVRTKPKETPRAKTPPRAKAKEAPRPRPEQPEADEAPRAQQPPLSSFQPGFAPECMACPIGLIFYAMKNTKPEVMEHMMKAGFEVFQAVRALMEQYNDRWEQGQQLQRIPIS